jgi:hypothetical protein
MKITGSGPDGSNDIILNFVSRPGAELIECQTHTHTEYGYYNIDENQYFDRGVVLQNEPQIETYNKNYNFIFPVVNFFEALLFP